MKTLFNGRDMFKFTPDGKEPGARVGVCCDLPQDMHDALIVQHLRAFDGRPQPTLAKRLGLSQEDALARIANLRRCGWLDDELRPRTPSDPPGGGTHDAR